MLTYEKKKHNNYNKDEEELELTFLFVENISI
jgi:hypothetical protein